MPLFEHSSRITHPAAHLPLIVFGWWVRRRAKRNIEAIETTFAEYLASIRGQAAVT